jgi:lysophospholipase L1-like esterase
VGLPRTTARLERDGSLRIVAVGSSSTVGVGTTDARHAYPSVLEAELAFRFPRARVQVLNRGVSGQTYHQMLQRFERDVLEDHPDLVIWQLGTNDLLREDGLGDDREELRAGVEQLRAAGSDVILMDPQFAPVVVADPDWPAMLQLLEAVAREAGVPVFHRFEVMRRWVERDGAALSALVDPDGLHLNDVSSGCLGQLLAEAIAVEVLRQAPPGVDSGVAAP